jgi:hypothetical protein
VRKLTTKKEISHHGATGYTEKRDFTTKDTKFTKEKRVLPHRAQKRDDLPQRRGEWTARRGVQAVQNVQDVGGHETRRREFNHEGLS